MDLRIVGFEGNRAREMLSSLRLLGALPLVTGGGIYVVLQSKLSEPANIQYLTPIIGVFGAMVTFALFLYEHVGIRRCEKLIKMGRRMERRLGIGYAGQFRHLPPEALNLLYEVAGALVYATVLAAWIVLAVLPSGFSNALWSGVAAFVLAFSGEARHRALRRIPTERAKLDTEGRPAKPRRQVCSRR